jgi:hypothetical protein
MEEVGGRRRWYDCSRQIRISKSAGMIIILYVWPELTNRFFKTPKFPQNEVRDGKIFENEGGSHLGV